MKTAKEILKPYLEEGDDWMIVTECNALAAMEAYADQQLSSFKRELLEKMPLATDSIINCDESIKNISDKIYRIGYQTGHIKCFDWIRSRIIELLK